VFQLVSMVHRHSLRLSMYLHILYEEKHLQLVNHFVCTKQKYSRYGQVNSINCTHESWHEFMNGSEHKVPVCYLGLHEEG